MRGMRTEPLLDIVAGARPNFMKVAPIIKAIREQTPPGLRASLSARAHRPALRRAHVRRLLRAAGDPPAPCESRGRFGHAGRADGRDHDPLRAYLTEAPADLTIVVGDVTSTMACAITAQKLHVPVAHVEGGIRSGDWTMPEEINRLATDAVTNWFFTTSETANANLRRMGVADGRLFFVGNTMIDTLLANFDRLRPADSGKTSD